MNTSCIYFAIYSYRRYIYLYEIIIHLTSSYTKLIINFLFKKYIIHHQRFTNTYSQHTLDVTVSDAETLGHVLDKLERTIAIISALHLQAGEDGTLPVKRGFIV